jgi:hypothetical protein
MLTKKQLLRLSRLMRKTRPMRKQKSENTPLHFNRQIAISANFKNINLMQTFYCTQKKWGGGRARRGNYPFDSPKFDLILMIAVEINKYNFLVLWPFSAETAE